MQSKTFIITLDPTVPEVDLLASGISFTLSGATLLHHNIDITISGGTLDSESIILSTPAVVDITNLISYSLTIKVSHPTSLDIKDLQLAYVNGSWKKYIRQNTVPMLNKYQAFHNFYDGTGNLFNDVNYSNPFTTTLLNLSADRVIDTQLQFSYDQSVNVVFTDDRNPIRLVNSRWILDEAGLNATIAERNQTKDTNTYSEEYFHRTELIPAYQSVAAVSFDGLEEGGKLNGGGYRYYFRYLTADGAETDIIEETRLIEVHRGNSVLTTIGESGKDSTGRTVTLTLSNLDPSYYAIRVYYSYSTGEVGAIASAYKIAAPFVIEDARCKILHTGHELITSINKDELDVNYSLISEAKTITTANNRLLAANTELENLYNRELAIVAARVKVGEGSFDIVYPVDIDQDTEDNYSNSNFSYDQTGYWRGETYELGVVYTSGSRLSPVYPVHGIDNLDGATYYNPDLVGNPSAGFFEKGENSLGVYRTSGSMNNFWNHDTIDETITFRGVNLRVDIAPLLGYSRNIRIHRLIEDSGVWVLHNKSTDTYYLDGTFEENHAAGEFSVVWYKLPDRTEDIFLTFTNPDGTTGEVRLVAGETKLEFLTDVVLSTKIQDGSAYYKRETPGDYTGFFFVRRERKPDKIAQGILTPTFSVPVYTSYNADAATASSGNWTGIGVKSEVHGENVTFLPAPNCLTPWGVENFIPGQVKLKTVPTEPISREPVPNPVIDFVHRAPILDYKEAKSWAFYSPDIDCNPVFFATKYSGRTHGVAVYQEKIPTEYVYLDVHPLWSDRLPYLLKLNSSYSAPEEIWRFKMEGNYAESGSFTPAGKSFSAKHDRNLAMFTREAVNKPGKVDYSYYVFNTETSNPFYKESKFYPVTVGVLADDPADTTYGPKNDSDVFEKRTPSTGVNYGRYLGVRLPDYLVGLDDLNMNTEAKNRNIDTKLQNVNWESSLLTVNRGYNPWVHKPLIPDPDTSYGFIANLYEGKNANELRRTAWQAKYEGDENTQYFAITRRYNINEFSGPRHKLDLYGGDCYLGMQWKQVWSPIGIEGSIQTNDFNAYRWNRTALGMLDYGFAMPVPVQSNYNFHLRVKERADEREYKVYGKDRTFLPIKSGIRGDRLIETGGYNFGYDDTGSEKDYFRLNTNTPYIKVSYPNRIYASNPGVENEFWNGFTVFRGLNFKDYNSELGAITKIITVNNFTYGIFHHGIAQIGVNERTMVSSDTGGVFADNAEVLAQKSNIISNDYGSQHLNSVAGSSAYLYGVDALSKKIWRTSQKGATLISDFKIQKLLTEIIDEKQQEAIDTPGVFNIYSSYDLIKGDITFTFVVLSINGTTARSLVFNEPLGIWISETDDTRNFFFKAREERYSFSATSTENTIYKYYRTETNARKSYYNKFYGVIYDAQIGFNILDDPATAKVFENLYVIGNQSMPYKVNYTLENVNDKKTQVLIPYTNISYTFPKGHITGLAGNDYFETFLMEPPLLKWNGEQLGKGDFITVHTESGEPTYFVCMGYEYVGSDPGKLYVNKKLTENFITQPLILGYPNAIRLATSAYEDTYTKIVCRTLEPKESSTIYVPRGKWAGVRLDYEGMNPLYIDKVIAAYTTSHS